MVPGIKATVIEFMMWPKINSLLRISDDVYVVH